MKIIPKLIFGIFLFVYMMLLQVYAANYYCDPVNGNMGNNGSKEHPWSTLQAVFENHKAFSGGDTIFLMAGYHGKPYLYGRNNSYVVIMRYQKDTASVGSMRFSSASFWEINGLDISSELPEGKTVYDFYYLIQTSSSSDHLIFRNCRVYSNDSTQNWTRDDWFNRTSSGFFLESTETFLNNNHIKNINFGVEIRGQHSIMTGDTVENFVGDAIRGLASYCRYENNVVMNCYDITGYNASDEGPGNHDDGFQSYTSAVGGVEEVVRDVVLRGNKFISYTDPDQIEKSMMQGIALFDGYYYNWIIENNLIVTDSWHGISLLGTDNSKIANNTILTNPIYNPLVLDGTPVKEMTPWIWVGPLKDDRGGGPSNNNIIRNNLIIQSNAGFNGNQSIYDQGENTLIQHNQEIPAGQENNWFTDPENFDYHLKNSSPAVNYGINIDLPETDLDQDARLVGPSVDAGAYECQTNTAGENAPVLDPVVNDSIMEGDTLILTFAATDADHDSLSFTLSPAVPFVSFTDNRNGTATLNVTPVTGNYGSYQFNIVVTDGTYTNTRSFIIYITKNPDLVRTDLFRENFNLYPNPVHNGSVFLQVTNTSFRTGELLVTDITGKTVYSQELSGLTANNRIRIEAPWTRKNGLYILKIVSDTGKVVTTKVLVTCNK